MSEFSLW